MKWLNITEELTEEGIKRLKNEKKQKVLIFFDGNKETHLKIRRISKGQVYAEQVTLYHPDDVKIEEKKK